MYYYRETLKNLPTSDRRNTYYERIFKYVKRFFNDTNNFLLDDNVKYISDKNLAISTRASLYNKFYNEYISHITDSSFYFFTSDMCLELESLMNGFLRGYSIEKNGKTYQLYELITALGFTSWVEKFKQTLSTNAVLVPSPVTGVDTNMWSNSNPIGFMFRELSDPNFFYDHSAFYDFFKHALGSWQDPVEKLDYNSEEFKSNKLLYDKAVINWLKSSTGDFVDAMNSLLSEIFVDSENYNSYTILKEGLNNEIALAILSYIDFSYTKFFILKENVISILIGVPSPIISEAEGSYRYNIYDFKTNIDSFLETMSDMMNICRSDLIAYTIEQINTFNDTV